MSNNNRPRAVFSTEDFGLLYQAMLHYTTEHYNKLSLEDAAKASRLMHRLGRITSDTHFEWK